MVVTKLDSLARNTREALNVINEFRDKNIKINILNLGIINQHKKIPRHIAEGFFLAMLFLYRSDFSGMVVKPVRVRDDILRTMFGSIKSAV